MIIAAGFQNREGRNHAAASVAATAAPGSDNARYRGTNTLFPVIRENANSATVCQSHHARISAMADARIATRSRSWASLDQIHAPEAAAAIRGRWNECARFIHVGCSIT